MSNQVEVKIDAAVICYDCAFKEWCPCTKKHVPIVGVTSWVNGRGIVTAFCHMRKGGEQ